MADHQKRGFITELNLDYYLDDKPEVFNVLKEFNGTKTSPDLQSALNVLKNSRLDNTFIIFLKESTKEISRQDFTSDSSPFISEN